MGYYVRAFCSSEIIPPLAEAIQYAEKMGVKIRVAGDTNVNESPWVEAELYYKKNKESILAECNIDDGNDDCLFREEVREFIDAIGSPGISLSKWRVISHLKKTRFIIACQLLSDIDDDGYHANGVFLRFFTEHCGGMVQAGGEGFYKGNKLILKSG